jgi:hypothetical protein
MSVRPDIGLERLIHGLEKELLEAADEEFMVGARDLGMNPHMKGSAAFIGVKSLTPQLLSALGAAYREHLERGSAHAAREDERDPAEPEPRRKSKRKNADA